MPAIARFYCTNEECGFSGPEGWGYYMYAIDDSGDRKTCAHPGEMARAREIIGPDATDEEIDDRTGFNYHCVCVDCATLFEKDPQRDALICPECESRAVTLMTELVGAPCPDCGEGTFIREDTGAIA